MAVLVFLALLFKHRHTQRWGVVEPNGHQESGTRGPGSDCSLTCLFQLSGGAHLDEPRLAPTKFSKEPEGGRNLPNNRVANLGELTIGHFGIDS